VYAAEQDALDSNVIYYKVYDSIYPSGDLTASDKDGNQLLALQANTEIRIAKANYPVVKFADDGTANVETGGYWTFEYDDGYGNNYQDSLYFRDGEMGFLR